MKFNMSFSDWLSRNDLPVVQTEEIQNIGSMDPEIQKLVYKHYYDTYKAAGLNPWSWDDFYWRAKNWLAAGVLPQLGPDNQEVSPEKVGFVTAKDNGGVVKLTGMDGPNNRAKVKGMMELVATGKPMWGAMDKDFTDKLQKAGFSTPPPAAMKLLYPIIQSDDQFYSGGTWGSMNPDGGINFDLMGVGKTVKYFTGNKPFYRMMLQKHGSKMGLSGQVLGMIKNWNSLPGMMQGMAKQQAAAKGIDEETLLWLVEIMSDQPVKEQPVTQSLGSKLPPSGMGQTGGPGQGTGQAK